MPRMNNRVNCLAGIGIPFLIENELVHQSISLAFRPGLAPCFFCLNGITFEKERPLQFTRSITALYLLLIPARKLLSISNLCLNSDPCSCRALDQTNPTRILVLFGAQTRETVWQTPSGCLPHLNHFFFGLFT